RWTSPLWHRRFSFDKRALPTLLRWPACTPTRVAPPPSSFPTVDTDDDTRAWVSGYLVPNLDVWVARWLNRWDDGAPGEMLDLLYVAAAIQRHGVGDRLLARAKKFGPKGLEL